MWVILKGYRLYCPSRSNKIVESIKGKFCDSDDNYESSKVRDIVSEEERQTISVPIVLKKIDRNILEHQPANDL